MTSSNQIPKIKARVYKINETLLGMGFSWGDIERFWSDCIKESQEKESMVKGQKLTVKE